MIMLFNVDIVVCILKKKLFFWFEQIVGFEYMYDGNDDYLYYLFNCMDENNGEMLIQLLVYYENFEVLQVNVYMLEVVISVVKEVVIFGVDVGLVNGNQVVFDIVN